MRGYTQFSFWIPIALAKICFSRIVINHIDTVLNRFYSRPPCPANQCNRYVLNSLYLHYYSRLTFKIILGRSELKNCLLSLKEWISKNKYLSDPAIETFERRSLAYKLDISLSEARGTLLCKLCRYARRQRDCFQNHFGLKV